MITDAQVEQLATTMATIQVYKDEIKRRSMFFQYEAKMRVAQHFGLTFEEVDLPIAAWMVMRRKYREATGYDP